MSQGVGIFNQSPQARWKVVEQPSALPGECFLCRGSAETREWFIDTTLQFEFHGAVYICNECLDELASTAGWMTPPVAASLREELESVKRENYRLLLENSAFNKMEQAIDEFISSRNSDSDPIATLHSYGDLRNGSMEPVKGRLYPIDGQSESGTQRTEDQLGEGTGEASEQSDGQGMDDLRSDDSGREFNLGL